MQMTTDGIVLSDHRIEDDRVLTILTRRFGVLTAYANGANRPKGRLAASTELLCYSRFVLFANRGRYVVDSADPNRIFFGIRADLELLSLASYFAELAKELSPVGEEADAQLRLLLNCLHFLESRKRGGSQLKAIIELRLLTMAGYMPQLVGCRECARFEAEEMQFLPLSGELLCGDCATDEDKPFAIPVGAGVLAAMRHIIYSPPEKLFSFSLSSGGLDYLAALSERYLQCRLEKTLPTLEFYHSLYITPREVTNIGCPEPPLQGA